MAAWVLLRPNGSTMADALVWLEGQGVQAAIALRLWPVMRQLWQDAYAMGLDAAGEASGYDGGVNPQNLDDLINAYGQQWVEGIARTITKQMAGVLGDSGALTAGEIEAKLAQVLASESHAKGIALTEVTRAASEATVCIYRAAAIDQVLWITDPASDVCATCEANQAAGPRYLGTPFPSGAVAPPQHVRCRCALLPYRS